MDREAIKVYYQSVIMIICGLCCIPGLMSHGFHISCYTIQLQCVLADVLQIQLFVLYS